jgi:hypothetical protein
MLENGDNIFIKVIKQFDENIFIFPQNFNLIGVIVFDFFDTKYSFFLNFIT